MGHGRLADSGRIGNISKQTAAFVVEQDVIVVGKGGDEDVHVAVMVVITDGDSHARHFLAVGAERHAGSDADLLKSAVLFIPIKIIRIRVVAYKQVRPAIIVEIFEHGLEPKIEVLVGHIGFRGDIRERAVAVVVIERVGRALIADWPAGVDH